VDIPEGEVGGMDVDGKLGAEVIWLEVGVGVVEPEASN
jgi:hypothetical protein